MSKKHGERIEAALELCHTDDECRSAFAYLTGYLSAEVSSGRITAEKLARAFEKAASHATQVRSWRSVAETELPEPRDVETASSALLVDEIPDLDPTHFSHAMTGIGSTIPWCGAPGPVAVFAFSVTCPVCRRMLTAEEEGDPGARTLAVSPLADDSSASDETAQEEIVEAAKIKREGQEELAADQLRTQQDAEDIIEEWTPGPELAAAVEADRIALPALAAAVVNGSTPRKLWVHSGPCVYCAHGPACVACDLTQGPHWGAAGHDYPGPVCGRCSEECKRREIAADPYYSGDYVAMFGDDE